MARPKLYDEALRRRLIDTAAQVIATYGVEGVALRSLATACGTSTNAVYTLFGDKETLVDTVLLEGMLSLHDDQRAVPFTDDPVQDLMDLGRAYRAWALANRTLYQVIFGGRLQFPESLELEGRQMARDGQFELINPLAPLLQHVARCRESRAEHLREHPSATDDLFDIVINIWAVTHGAITTEMLVSRTGTDKRVDGWDWSTAYDAQLQMICQFWLGVTPG